VALVVEGTGGAHLVRELEPAVRRTASALAALGVRPRGSRRVALPSEPLYLELYFGRARRRDRGPAEYATHCRGLGFQLDDAEAAGRDSRAR